MIRRILILQALPRTGPFNWICKKNSLTPLGVREVGYLSYNKKKLAVWCGNLRWAFVPYLGSVRRRGWKIALGVAVVQTR